MKSVNSNPQLPAIQADVEATASRIASSSFSDADVNAAISTEFIETLRSAKTGAISGEKLARLIDHTLLKADARQADFDKICAEARTHGFASVCVNSAWIARVAEALKGSSTLPIAVVGFPLGAMETTAKADETRRAIALGAREIDMVLPVGALKDRAYDVVEKDIQAVVQAAGNAPVKVILETAYLTREEIIAGCVISKRAGAAFVKTSTGFATPAAGQPSGATVENIKLMRLCVGPTMGVKASGGIRTREDALKMIAAGASRIGASASVAMVTASGGGATDGY